MKEGVCLGIAGTRVTKIWELTKMVGCVVQKISLVTK
jgi:hypothetical protein